MSNLNEEARWHLCALHLCEAFFQPDKQPDPEELLQMLEALEVPLDRIEQLVNESFKTSESGPRKASKKKPGKVAD